MSDSDDDFSNGTVLTSDAASSRDAHVASTQPKKKKKRVEVDLTETTLGPLVLYQGLMLTKEEADLMQLFEKLKAKEETRRALVPPGALAELQAKTAQKKKEEQLQHLKKKEAKEAMRPPPPAGLLSGRQPPPPPSSRGPSMLDRFMPTTTEVDDPSSSSSLSPSTPSSAEAAASATSSSNPSSTSSSLSLPSAKAMPIMKKKLTKRALAGSSQSSTGTSSQAPAAKRTMFDKGELHASLPAQFVVWAGSPDWEAELADDALEVRLPSSSAGSSAEVANALVRDTLVVTATIPAASTRFALNVCPREHGGGEEVWLHFNPRQFERGGSLVVDFKIEGEWIRHERRDLAALPQLFGLAKCQLAFHVGAAGIRVAMNGHLFLQFGWRPHQQAPPVLGSSVKGGGLAAGDELALHLPTTDDRGDPSKWTVHGVWWGPLSALQGGGGKGGARAWRANPWTCGGDAIGFGPVAGLGGGALRAGGGSSSSGGGGGGGGTLSEDLRMSKDMHIGNLPRFTEGSEEFADAAKHLEEFLERALGGADSSGVVSVLPTLERGFAFVKFAAPADLRLALRKLDGKSAELFKGSRPRFSAARPPPEKNAAAAGGGTTEGPGLRR